MMQLVEVMFWFSSLWIIPLWSLMWFLPRPHITARVMNDLRICILPLLIPYAVMVLPNLLDIVECKPNLNVCLDDILFVEDQDINKAMTISANSLQRCLKFALP